MVVKQKAGGKAGGKATDKKKPVKVEKLKKPGAGGKAKKKKWSKGKVRDKLESKSYLDEATYEKCLKEIPKMTLVSPAVLAERYKIRVSAARRLMNELISQNLIKTVVKDSTRMFCTRTTKEAV